MDDIKCDKEKIQKIKNIIEQEIEKELINKQNEVTDISEKIKIILRNLDLLKYIVAVNYYDQNSCLTQKKGPEDESEEEKTQTQIHPSIKKLMPICSNNNKSFSDALFSRNYETRNSKKTGSNEANLVLKKEEEALKIPQYIPPLPGNENVGTVNSSRGDVLKERYRIIIGNISKWIPSDTREDNSTHKWMVYIRTKDGNKDVTKLLRKVRYFLHESYKPHDIIDVTSPPFHLTRRGWGEFPVRVQLHFVHPLDKPIDVIHNLKLDMTCSGVQMLGAETAIEVSLHQSDLISNGKIPTKLQLNNTSKCEENVKEKQDVFDGTLLTSINGIKPNNCIVDVKHEVDCQSVIKQESENIFENVNQYNLRAEEVNAALNHSRKFLLDRRKAMKIIEIEHNYLKSNDSELVKPFNKVKNKILSLENKHVDKMFKNGEVLDSVQLNQIQNRKSISNKVEVTASRSEEEIFRNLKSVAIKLENESQTKYCANLFKNMYLVNVAQRLRATKLTSVEALVKWLVQRWPIITKLSIDSTYKIVHPYSSPTEKEFAMYNIGKQRSAEWFRAKAIQKVLISLKSSIPVKEEIWSTKQILLWSRFHGYSPSSFQKSPKCELDDANEIRKRLKSTKSSSESEDEGWDYSNKKLKTCDSKFLNGFNVNEKKKNFKKSRRKDLSEEVLDRHKNYKNCNTYVEAKDFRRFGANDYRILQPSGQDSDVEVVELEKELVKESPTKKKEAKLSVITCTSGEILFNKFVCETMKQIGVKVVEEELIPGVKTDSVLRVMSRGVYSFLDELLRRSFAHAWLRNGDRCPDSLEVNDILATLIEYQHFDIFTNGGLGTQNSSKS